jgi:outer membrane lipoprotein SlyB
MKAIVGVFKSRSDAERGAAELVPLEIPSARINILTAEVTDKEIAAVPTVASEQPGMGEAMGAVVGGAMGVAGGAGFAPAIASLLVPGVGPVLGIGILAGTLLAAIGAVAGGAIGAAMESAASEGVPENELFIYEDALRKGRTVVVVMAEDDDANAVRGALEFAGAETIDRAREMWWLGLRNVEKEHYSADGPSFAHDERDFRAGFEAALRLRNRSRSCEECYQELDGRDAHDSAAFRGGYERGRQYLEAFRKRASA